MFPSLQVQSHLHRYLLTPTAALSWVCDLLFLSPSEHWSPVLYIGHKDTRLVRGEEREEEREREEKRERRGEREITDPGLLVKAK